MESPSGPPSSAATGSCCTSRCRLGISPEGIYGRFAAMRWKGRPHSEKRRLGKNSLFRPGPNARIFPSKAQGVVRRSVALTTDPAISRARVRAITPEPVPTSRMEGVEGSCFADPLITRSGALSPGGNERPGIAEKGSPKKFGSPKKVLKGDSARALAGPFPKRSPLLVGKRAVELHVEIETFFCPVRGPEDARR